MAIKLGTEDKKKRLIAMVFVPLALALIAHTVWQLASGPPTAPRPATAAVNNAVVPNPGSTTANREAQHIESAASLDPTLHPEWMAKAEDTIYSGTSRNIFSKDSLPPAQMNAIESPIASARTGNRSSIAAGPPGPPPIDLKFYGFARQQNGRKLVFLMHGEDVFIAGKGDIVDGRYEVVQINDNSVIVEDLAYRNRQTLPLLVS